MGFRWANLPVKPLRADEGQIDAARLTQLEARMAEAPARVIAEATDYKSLLSALRARAAELGISRLEIDDIGGLTGGYASKLLAPTPMKFFGRVSLGPLLGALGVKLVVVEDEALMRRIEPRLAYKRASAGRPRSRNSSLAPGEHVEI